MWHIGTRYNFADTYAHIMGTGAVKPRVYPATADGTKDGRPVLFDQAEWDRRVQTQLESTIATQMLQNPLAGSQRWFDPDDLQIYEWRPESLMVYLMVDPARSKKKGSANTAMAVVGIDASNNNVLEQPHPSADQLSIHIVELLQHLDRRFDVIEHHCRQSRGVIGRVVQLRPDGAIAPGRREHATVKCARGRSRRRCQRLAQFVMEAPSIGQLPG
jgi:hypothetical protein